MEKPWTVSREPVVATEFDIRKADAINALLIRPVAILPTRPGDPIRPFAIGLWSELRSLLKPDVNVTSLRRATGAFLHSKRYYLACAQPDSMRHDIDGEATEQLSPADRLAAQQQLLGLKKLNEEAREPVAETPSPAPAATKADQIRAGLLRRSRSA